MITNSEITAGLYPGTEYTMQEIADNAGINVSTLSRRMPKLISGRYFRAKGYRDGDGRKAKTYVLDIAAGAGWTTRLADQSMVESFISKPSLDWRYDQAYQMVWGWQLYLLRYLYAFKNHPSPRYADEARAEMNEGISNQLRRVRALIDIYTTIENAIETNDPFASGLLDLIETMEARLAQNGTDLETVLRDMEELFVEKAN